MKKIYKMCKYANEALSYVQSIVFHRHLLAWQQNTAVLVIFTY